MTSARKCNIKMHLKTERALFPHFLIFRHPCYIGYLTYKYALMEFYQIINTSIRKLLLKNFTGIKLRKFQEFTEIVQMLYLQRKNDFIFYKT